MKSMAISSLVWYLKYFINTPTFQMRIKVIIIKKEGKLFRMIKLDNRILRDILMTYS